MKLRCLLIFFSISILGFTQNKVQDFERLDLEKVKADLDTIRAEMDSTFYYINETCKILKEEVEVFGLKKTIQMNSDIFLPFVVFCGLYILWLIKRKP